MDVHRLLSNAQNLLTEAQSSVSTGYDNAYQQVLDRLGLQQKQDASDMILPALGIFGAGLAVGAVLGLLFAPRRGEETRTEIVHRLEDLREKVRSDESEEERAATGEAAE
jgi:hypothetical protein